MYNRDHRLYLADILESAKAIQDYVRGYSFHDFSDDRKTYSAVIREFEIIGKLSVNSLMRSNRSVQM